MEAPSKFCDFCGRMRRITLRCVGSKAAYVKRIYSKTDYTLGFVACDNSEICLKCCKRIEIFSKFKEKALELFAKKRQADHTYSTRDASLSDTEFTSPMSKQLKKTLPRTLQTYYPYFEYLVDEHTYVRNENEKCALEAVNTTDSDISSVYSDSEMTSNQPLSSKSLQANQKSKPLSTTIRTPGISTVCSDFEVTSNRPLNSSASPKSTPTYTLSSSVFPFSNGSTLSQPTTGADATPKTLYSCVAFSKKPIATSSALSSEKPVSLPYKVISSTSSSATKQSSQPFRSTANTLLSAYQPATIKDLNICFPKAEPDPTVWPSVCPEPAKNMQLFPTDMASCPKFIPVTVVYHAPALIPVEGTHTSFSSTSTISTISNVHPVMANTFPFVDNSNSNKRPTDTDEDTLSKDNLEPAKYKKICPKGSPPPRKLKRKGKTTGPAHVSNNNPVGFNAVSSSWSDAISYAMTPTLIKPQPCPVTVVSPSSSLSNATSHPLTPFLITSQQLPVIANTLSLAGQSKAAHYPKICTKNVVPSSSLLSIVTPSLTTSQQLPVIANTFSLARQSKAVKYSKKCTKNESAQPESMGPLSMCSKTASPASGMLTPVNSDPSKNLNHLPTGIMFLHSSLFT